MRPSAEDRQSIERSARQHASAIANVGRDHRGPDRDPKLVMPERRDPASGLHRILDRCCAIAEVGGGRVDVRDDVRDPPEGGWTLARSLWRTDDFDDDLPGPEEDLADRSSAELAVPLSARFDTQA